MVPVVSQVHRMPATDGRPKAIFLDVDGTLVNDRGTVPDSARTAVRCARARGHRVFLSTGRSTSELWDTILAVGFDGVIAAAGGYVEHDGRVLAHTTVPLDSVRRAIEFFDTHAVEYFLESNSGLFGSAGCKRRMRELVFGPVRDEDVLAEMERGLGGFIDGLLPIPDPLPDDINKLSFLDSTVSFEQVRSELGDVFELIPTTVPMFGPHSGELSRPGVTKGAAVELLANALGVHQQDTVSFGDGLNDLEMLHYTAVGIAMGNAHPDVIAAADGVTRHVDDDGLWHGFRALDLIGDESGPLSEVST